MEIAKKFFLENTILYLKGEIKKNGGNELFAIGKVDKGIVSKVEIIARGNRYSVSAILNGVKSGEVVIHNHPSGNLTPSDNDIYLASLFGNEGVGFYIVDNTVKNVNVVVELPHLKEIEPVKESELEEIFNLEGKLSSKLKGYEYRENQLEMAKLIADSFFKENVLLVEAPTGIGKSFAYLVPAILFSLRNEKRIVISTKSINLQEQLIYKDIPLLQKIIPGFKAVLLKGRGNYLCLRRFQILRSDISIIDEGLREEFNEIVKWQENTEDGSLSDLNFIPSKDLWSQISSQVETCKNVRCKFYKRCYFFKMKWESNSANIIVTNHHLLMADLKLRENGATSTALPSCEYFILDESHKLEDATSSFLSLGTSFKSITYNFGFLESIKDPTKGLLPFLSRKLYNLYNKVDKESYTQIALINKLIEDKFLRKRLNLNEELKAIFKNLRKKILKIINNKKESKLRIDKDIFSNVNYKDEVGPLIKEVIVKIEELLNIISKIKKKILLLDYELPEEIKDILVEISGVTLRISEHIENLHYFTDVSHLLEDYCHWLEIRKASREGGVTFYTSPVEIGDFLRNYLYLRNKSVIMTSATLCVDNSFDFFRGRIGLENIDSKMVVEKSFPPYFNFKENVFFGILNDLPNPSNPTYIEEFSEFLENFFSNIKLGTFILFTSYNWLNYSYEYLRDELIQHKLFPLKHGEIPRKKLIEKFKKKKNCVLFGTDSFWEGVDVKGEALSCIIIPKLPFLVPTEPLLEAKFELLKKRGKNPFMDFSLPMAILKLKQGCGRLIRSKEDKGIILICDKRMITREYGKKFLRSLPEMNPYICTKNNLFVKIKEWINENLI